MSYQWEQLPREGAKPFTAFKVYLEMGEKRSVPEVASRVKKCSALIRRWAAKFDWHARALAFDGEKAKIAIKAIEQEAAANAGIWSKRIQKQRETEWEMHEAAIAAARRGIDAYLSREKVYGNLSDIARILEVASKLGRLATGAGDGEQRSANELPAVRVEFNLALEKVYSDPLPGELAGQPALPVAPAGSARRLRSAATVDVEPLGETSKKELETGGAE